jgi:hypothetical protein
MSSEMPAVAGAHVPVYMGSLLCRDISQRDMHVRGPACSTATEFQLNEQQGS